MINRKNLIKARETTMKGVFFLSSLFSVFALLAIIGFLLYNSMPAIKELGFIKLLGDTWLPASEKNPQYGIMPFLLGTLYTTLLAIIMGVPLGVFTAIFLFRFCNKRLAGLIKHMINLLASLPSVVFGLFGLLFVVPFLRRISPTGIGEGIFAAGIILSIMILPTIVNLSLNALEAVPKSIYEGALALGASREQAVFKAVLPAAKSGVIASIVLAIGRAMGEAMAVSMVIGLNNNLPESLFMPANTLASLLAVGTKEGIGLHLSALFVVGLMLFIFSLVLNSIFALVRGGKNNNKAKRGLRIFKLGFSKITNRLLRVFSYIATLLSLLALIGIVAGVFYQGMPHVNFNFIFGKFTTSKPTLSGALKGTIYLIAISLPISLLIGGATAIFLAEYASKSRFIRYIKTVIETLAGIPSVVYGMFGYALFVIFFGFGKSLLAGGLTLSIMLLPIIVRTVEESLLAVPSSLREASLALGAGKVRTTFRVVLPCALGSITSAIILAVARVVAETSMLIMTIGMVTLIMPDSVMSSGTSLALNVYYFFQAGKIELAAATCVILFIMVLSLNLLATLFRVLFSRVKEHE